MPGLIAIAGSLAQKPTQGGFMWVFLQYLLGFRRLGWEVLFLDRLEPAMCRDDAGGPCSLADSLNLRMFLKVMDRFEMSGAYCLQYNRGRHWIGMTREHVLDRLSQSRMLINIMGFLDDPELLEAAPRRVFLDIDPGFGQMWKALDLADIFQGHEQFVTIGENIGKLDCTVPTCGLEWITSPQPVVLDQWPGTARAPAKGFTSVMSWRGAYGPVEYGGKTYGLRVHEFRKFASLPNSANEPFEIALDIHPSDAHDVSVLKENGWKLVAPKMAAGDPWTYRSYVQDSMAEFMVAKNMYVQSHCGWLSDRSLCYLASGRPVLAQDTGLGNLYPLGEGLRTFTTLNDAMAGVEAISRNYERHARAARALAEEYFDSDKVLAKLLNRLDIETKPL